MARTRKKPAVETPVVDVAAADIQPAAQPVEVKTVAENPVSEAVAAKPETAPSPSNQNPTEPPASEVNPFPRNIKTVVLADGYKIRLDQARETNQVQIKFGEGKPGDKPSDEVIAFIKAQVGPNGTKFHWNNDDRAWGMSIRDPNHDPQLLSTREAARKVFNQVVKMVAQERGTSPAR